MSEDTSLVNQLLDDVTPFIAWLPGPVGRATPVSRLTVWTSTTATSPVSAVFDPMFYAVIRGTKVLTMGANRFALEAGACAASSFGLPYSHQLSGATPDNPYVGISLHLDVDKLNRVMLDMPNQSERWTCAVAAGELDGTVGQSFGRLVGLLNMPDDIDVLAPHYESELYYRLLQSSMGDTLRQIVQRNERFQQIKAAADWLGVNNSKPIAISELAVSAGMSPTSFYRHFKAVTGHSPLAFQRHMRLLEARKLLTAGSLNVSSVAYEVGYQSPSQFSREYKSLFGSSPATDFQR
jgi:AraC-like DNA-binding protein